MSTIFSGFSGYAAIFVLTVLSGVLLSNIGQPYNTLVFTIHKLLAVATVILVARYVYKLNQAVDVSSLVGPGGLFMTGLLFVALIISGALLSLQGGALLSLQTPLLGIIHTVHQVTPVLALAAAGLTVYLLTVVRA